MNSSLAWHYTLSLDTSTHCFLITLCLSGWEQDYLELHMPVWTPGSYLIREYGRLVQGFRAATAQGVPLEWQKKSKNVWRIAASPAMRVSYEVFSYDLTVRTNHVDHSHGFCNGAATFFYCPGWEHGPISLEIQLPDPAWRIATALPLQQELPPTYWAKDFHTLVDSPIEMGIQERIDFEVRGKLHHWVMWGKGNAQLSSIVADTSRIISQTLQLFGDLPYEEYWFLLHLSNTGNGGLEHHNCCALNYPRLGFRGDAYLRFLNLVSHEFFHAWNVKRLCPEELITIDYDRENYTRLLWFCEGVTSYYDQLIPLRAGLYDSKHFLRLVSENITRYLSTPGRHEQPLAESSFDTWIKLYRPDAHSPNSQISYYLKGDLLAMLLDLRLRELTCNQRSLDRVMQCLWERFGKQSKGYTATDIDHVVSEVAGSDVRDWLHRYLYTTAELDFNASLEPFGLQLLPQHSPHSHPHLGMQVKTVQGAPIVHFVEAKGPAQRAGIMPGDELLAINGLRTPSDTLTDRLRDFAPGDVVEVSVFQRDELRTLRVHLGLPQPDRYHVVLLSNPTIAQQVNLQQWLGNS